MKHSIAESWSHPARGRTSVGGQESDSGNIYACLLYDVLWGDVAQNLKLNHYYVAGSFFHFGDRLKSACHCTALRRMLSSRLGRWALKYCKAKFLSCGVSHTLAMHALAASKGDRRTGRLQLLLMSKCQSNEQFLSFIPPSLPACLPYPFHIHNWWAFP